MELWIRSQDRKSIVKPINILLENPLDYGEIGIRGYFSNNSYKMLGYYKTEQRALEVLDEIQSLLTPKIIINTFNIEKVDMLNGNQYSIFENNIKDFSIKQFDTYVYEMPKE